MLWAYFDESGKHNKTTGNVDWLVFGGAIATEESWQQVSLAWTDALADFSIPSPFHMVDFAHNKPPFDKLDEVAKQALLNRLLDIQSAHLKEIIGITNSRQPYQTEYTEIHSKCLRDILTLIRDKLAYTDEQISVVFAEHPEVSFKTISRYFDDFKSKSAAFAYCGVDKPINRPPLQMADLIAYELSLSMRDGFPTRYPYNQMKKSAQVNLFLLAEARGTAVSSGRAGLSLKQDG